MVSGFQMEGARQKDGMGDKGRRDSERGDGSSISSPFAAPLGLLTQIALSCYVPHPSPLADVNLKRPASAPCPAQAVPRFQLEVLVLPPPPRVRVGASKDDLPRQHRQSYSSSSRLHWLPSHQAGQMNSSYGAADK